MVTVFWINNISKEMTNVCIAFDNIDGVTPDDMSKGKINPGYEHVNLHMIFDINMDGKFTRNSILVTDVHTTAPPSLNKFSSVVSRNSVRVKFTLAFLDYLEIFYVI